MYAVERQRLIADRVGRDGRAAVGELAHLLGVTTETVRRDLDRLEASGAVRRVHGGVVSATRTSTAEPTVTERTRLHNDIKDRLGRRATVFLTENASGSIYLDAGTTTATAARALTTVASAASSPLHLVTHSVTIAGELAGHNNIELTMIGGRVRGVTAAAVGAGTVRSIGRLRPDIAFLGTNGLSGAAGLTTPDPEEAAVKEAIIASARRRIVLADSSKFGVDLLTSFAQWSDIDVLVTNARPEADLAAALADADVEVWLA